MRAAIGKSTKGLGFHGREEDRVSLRSQGYLARAARNKRRLWLSTTAAIPLYPFRFIQRSNAWSGMAETLSIRGSFGFMEETVPRCAAKSRVYLRKLCPKVCTNWEDLAPRFAPRRFVLPPTKTLYPFSPTPLFTPI